MQSRMFNQPSRIIPVLFLPSQLIQLNFCPVFLIHKVESHMNSESAFYLWFDVLRFTFVWLSPLIVRKIPRFNYSVKLFYIWHLFDGSIASSSFWLQRTISESTGEATSRPHPRWVNFGQLLGAYFQRLSKIPSGQESHLKSPSARTTNSWEGQGPRKDRRTAERPPGKHWSVGETMSMSQGQQLSLRFSLPLLQTHREQN